MAGKPIAAFALLTLVVGATGPFAQQKESFAAAQKQNREALMRYTWVSRTEIKVKGQSKSVQFEQVRYDSNAKLQKTPLGEPPPQEAPKPGGRRGGRRGERLKQKVIENKKEDFAALLKSLGQLVGGYAHLAPDAMKAFAEGAKVVSEGDSVVITGVDVLQPGDRMTVSIDPSSSMMKRVEIHTAFDEKPVHFVTEFRALTEGPTYPAHSVLEYPDKEVELLVDNDDYAQLGE